MIHVIKFESSDFPKSVLDTRLKSRVIKMKVKDFEMEVFKCDPCIISNTKKDKNERELATSFAMYLIFLLSKPVFNSDTSHASSMSIRDEMGNAKWAKQLGLSLSEVIEKADVFRNSRSRLNDASRGEIVTLEKCVDKIHPPSLAKNLFDAVPGRHGFGRKRNDNPSCVVKTGPRQEKEVEIATASITGDPNMDFNLIQEAEECSTLNFEDTKDPKSASGPSADGIDDPMGPLIDKPIGPVVDQTNGPVEDDPTPSRDDNPDSRVEVNFSSESQCQPCPPGTMSLQNSIRQ